MRFVDVSTLEVVSRRDDERPPYAILSHTWGRDEEEVTLQDMQAWFAAAKADVKASTTNTITQRPGFLKIQDAANLARSDGFDFIWVDTCCIDKTSSAELSEAINSMFAWYKSAEICYAFLSDIADSSCQSPVDVDLIGRSRWFTRGWTLQELIAPSSVRFYSKSWGLLGFKGTYNRSPQHGLSQPEVTDRESFLSMLERVTGIDRSLLDGSSDIDDFGVSARMKWASLRQTTRVEDEVYCLMGLFDVNMPLIYGEGAKAFVRLQEAILLATDDHSIFAWRCPENKKRSDFTGLLAESPAYFQNSGHIKPLPSSFMSESTPWSITNVGMRVTLALFKLHDVLPQYASNPDQPQSLFAAVLDCSPYRAAKSCSYTNCKPAIILICLGGDQYARLNPTTLLDIPVTKRLEHIDLTVYKNIYVKQKPVMLMLPEIYLDDQNLRSQWSLSKVHGPRGSWDERAKIFRCKKIGAGGVLCTFCYSLRGRIDVVVGVHNDDLSRPDLARFWCKIRQVNTDDRKQASAVHLADPSETRSSHGFRNLQARIFVGEATHRKHNNITLEIQSLEILQERDVLWNPKIIAKLSRPTMSSTVYDHCSLDPALLPLKSLVNFEDETLDPNLPGLYPIRIKNVLPEIVNGDAAFFLDEFYVESLDEPISEIMAGIRFCIDHRFKSSVNDRLRRLECLKSEESVLKFISSSAHWDSKAWRYFLTFPLKRPVTGKGCTWHVSHSVIREPTATEYRQFGDEWIYPSNARHIEFSFMHYVVARNYATALKTLIELEPNHALFQKAEGTWTPLDVACMLGHDRAVEVILAGSEQKWAEVFAEYTDLDHPLFLAISCVRDHRLVEIVRCFKNAILIAYPTCGANWISQTRNITGETALHRAAALNNTIALEAIASHLAGASEVLDTIDMQGRTPLWHAAAAGSFETLKVLLERGADPNARDFHGLTIMHAACKAPFDASRLVQTLQAHGGEPNAYIEIAPQTRHRLPILVTALFLAALHNSVATLEVLMSSRSVEYGSFTHQGSISPLHIAAANGHLDCVRVLTRAGFDPDAATPYKLIVQLKHKNELESTTRKRTQVWMAKRIEAKIEGAKAMTVNAWLQENREHMKHVRLPNVEAALEDVDRSRTKNAAPSARNVLSNRLKQRLSMPERKSKVLSIALRADLESLMQLHSRHREVAATIEEIELHDLGEWKTPLQLALDGGHLPVVEYLRNHAEQLRLFAKAQRLREMPTTRV